MSLSFRIHLTVTLFPHEIAESNITFTAAHCMWYCKMNGRIIKRSFILNEDLKMVSVDLEKLQKPLLVNRLVFNMFFKTVPNYSQAYSYLLKANQEFQNKKI